MQNVLSTSEEGFAADRWLQMRKLVYPPAAGSGTDHFSDADYKTKDVCDATTVTNGERQDVMLDQSLRHRSILDRFFRI